MRSENQPQQKGRRSRANTPSDVSGVQDTGERARKGEQKAGILQQNTRQPTCNTWSVSHSRNPTIQYTTHRPVLPREVLVVGPRRYDSPEVVARAALPPRRSQPVVRLNRQPGGLRQAAKRRQPQNAVFERNRRTQHNLDHRERQILAGYSNLTDHSEFRARVRRATSPRKSAGFML